MTVNLQNFATEFSKCETLPMLGAQVQPQSFKTADHRAVGILVNQTCRTAHFHAEITTAKGCGSYFSVEEE